MVRSVRLVEAGGGLVLACYVGMLVVMPGFTPFENLNCLTPTQCFNGLNPDYPLVFVVSIAGTVLLLFGLFGRRFVISRVFVIGMIALEYGLAGVVSASLDTETGVIISPVFFSPFVAIGAVVLSLQALRRMRSGRSELAKYIPR